mmetsp:Transcript_27528/g.48652  ORF Transcript_27528/g.48652 Transcript_27528/m.48652 type:complete len:245 (-) Transcript_27528:1603-2337(-)
MYRLTLFWGLSVISNDEYPIALPENREGLAWAPLLTAVPVPPPQECSAFVVWNTSAGILPLMLTTLEGTEVGTEEKGFFFLTSTLALGSCVFSSSSAFIFGEVGLEGITLKADLATMLIDFILFLANSLLEIRLEALLADPKDAAAAAAERRFLSTNDDVPAKTSMLWVLFLTFAMLPRRFGGDPRLMREDSTLLLCLSLLNTEVRRFFGTFLAFFLLFFFFFCESSKSPSPPSPSPNHTSPPP